MSENPTELKHLYELRFKQAEYYRNEIWKVLIESYFSRWIDKNHDVLDLGCGYGEFINNINCRNRYGMDLNPASRSMLRPGIQFLEQDCSATWEIPDESLDVVFTSNFLEHLPDKDAVKRTLAQCQRCLRPGGMFIAMGPNIRCLPGAYWDFFDHHVILTERSLAEVLKITGFGIQKAIARFLPYTMVGAPRYPVSLLRLYLALPWLWWLKGRQFLVVASKQNLSQPPA